MRLAPYRAVLALPGMRSLMVVALLARVPITATAVTLTLHVVLTLDRGYAAAGFVGAALTVGAALGAPLNGRFVDRKGLRPMLAVTTVVEAVFWAAAPTMSYFVLLSTALLAGMLALPVFSVVRQSVAALVPEDQRRQAYALDSMSVELSFMIGPTLAVLLVTNVSSTVAMITIGAAIVASGAALFVTNPPVRPVGEAPHSGPRPRRREWLTLPMLGVLAASAATTMVLAGTDVSIVAILRQDDQVAWTGVVLMAWGGYSMVGGFVYGVLPRPISLVILLGMLSVFTVTAGLAPNWIWLLLLLLPAGALCAPSISASSELVSRMVPASVRGEAMGWHGSAMTTGLAIGAPLAGAAIDLGGPRWGFAAVGAAGGLITLLLIPLRHRLAPASPPTTEITTVPAAPTPGFATAPCLTQDGDEPITVGAGMPGGRPA